MRCAGTARREWIRLRPEKYQEPGKNEWLVEDIEIKNLARNEWAFKKGKSDTAI